MRRTVPSSLSSLFGRCFDGAAVVVMLATVGLFSSGCEDKAIGRTCEVSGNAAGQMSGVQLNTALECPTRLCVQPPQAVASVDTKPFCTAECSDDSDCDDAQRRDSKDTSDKRCVQGFTCAVPFETGSLCCKKLCVCRDFLPAGYKSNSELPATCQKSFSSCQNI